MNNTDSAPPAAPVISAPPADLLERHAAAADLLRKAWPAVPANAGACPQARATDVALYLDQMGMDSDTLLAVLLTGNESLTGEDLGEEYSPAVAALVDGVRNMSRIAEFRRTEGNETDPSRLEGLRKLLLVMAEDLRVMIARLSICVLEMRGLKGCSGERQRELAAQVMDIYAPLANRLGIGQMKWELEDLSFRYLEPQQYQEIASHLAERRQDREQFISDAVGLLKRELAQEGLQVEVSGRPKHIYSIWKKMSRKGLGFHELYDVRAVRILTHSVRDCYSALGIVHHLWPHIPSEFDDYIAKPKGNNYQSLHTAVAGPGGRTLEIQIRSLDMHRHAEFGVAAHWRYKEGGGTDTRLDNRIAWLRQLLDTSDEAGVEDDFLDSLKSEVMHDRVYTLSPQGEVIDLPLGATPVDFAYAVHSEVGNRCRGAKVGGAMVPLTYTLQNGDQVEILTARNGVPSRDWLNSSLGYLKTSRARNRVRAWFRKQDFEQNLADGRDSLDRELRRLGLSDVNLEQLAQRLKFDKVDELFAAMGRGDVGSGQIAGALQDRLLKDRPVLVKRPRRERAAGRQQDDVTIDGVGNLLTQMARCCKPAPPEPIAGYITRGQGVTVHRQDCSNILRLAEQDRSRVIEVNWASGGEERVYPVDISIEAWDRKGLLRDVSNLISNEKVNLTGINTRSDASTSIAYMELTVEVADVDVLSRVLSRLNQLQNVIEVRRKN